ncbi:ABC transporter permease [Luedemannella flava]
MATITQPGEAEPDEISAPVPGAPPRANKLSRWQKFKRDRSLLVMVLPTIVLLIVFAYIPMLGTVTAFQQYDIYSGFRQSPWVGFYQFERLFTDPIFWHALENTLVISAVQLVLYFPIPIILALLLNTILSTRIRSFIQTIVYLPHFFSFVLVVAIFMEMLGGAGALNTFLIQHDLPTWDIMTDPGSFKYLVTVQMIWKEAGWGIIVFLAALAMIDQSLYEAAAADGAGRWRRLWHITLPGIRGVVVLMLVLRMGSALTVGFEQMLIQRQAVGRDASEVLDTFSYFYGVVANNFSYGAAAGCSRACSRSF